MNESFVIGLDGLKAGSSHFEGHADGKFFGEFENSEILDADLKVGIDIEKSASSAQIDCHVEGTVTVACDRCLADLSLPVCQDIRLTVRYGQEDAAAEEDGREVVVLAARDEVLDLGQILYDYVCTSLPLIRVHPEGECDPEVVKYLGTTAQEPARETESENPFASLKSLLEKK